MNFGHKHIKTGSSCSHELATFLKGAHQEEKFLGFVFR